MKKNYSLKQMGAFCVFGLLLSTICSEVDAGVIDPEIHIKKHGYHSVGIGEDGRTKFFSYTEKVSSSLISVLETDVIALPKHADVFQLCDFMRGAVKALLIKERGIAFDVAVVNYGYSDSTIVCVLKYMHETTVGTQLIFSKKGAEGMYSVFVSD
ncbi:MAG: hypothetical protein L6Q60_06630 [Rhodocyclaceae bacterium]|nr:hypothetical protein [Rhodocyclaceae bacterium]